MKEFNHQGRNMAAKNAFYAQSGGVTAVINASAAGVIETAREHGEKIGKVYAGRNGIIGALTEDLHRVHQGATPHALGRIRLLPLQIEKPGTEPPRIRAADGSL